MKGLRLRVDDGTVGFEGIGRLLIGPEGGVSDGEVNEVGASEVPISWERESLKERKRRERQTRGRTYQK